jgi:YjbE family integral membrane protein
MWRELRTSRLHPQNAEEAWDHKDIKAGGTTCGRPRKTLGQAIWQITLADVSMSLDNVLAVAGAAREHPLILIFGLGLSIALMGFAASFIANVLQRHRWIAYVGLLIILYVAFDMCYRGAQELSHDVNV